MTPVTFDDGGGGGGVGGLASNVKEPGGIIEGPVDGMFQMFHIRTKSIFKCTFKKNGEQIYGVSPTARTVRVWS